MQLALNHKPSMSCYNIYVIPSNEFLSPDLICYKVMCNEDQRPHTGSVQN